MRLDLVSRDCIQCPNTPPACTCPADQTCVQISRTCTACPSFTCQPNTDTLTGNTSGGGGGVSQGALAGAVVAALLAVAGAVALYFWYRRRARARKAAALAQEPKVDVPASAEAVLNRPDPTEKPIPPVDHTPVRVYSSSSDSVIDLNPQSRGPSASGTAPLNAVAGPQSNPFDDGHSIQTTSTGTQGTNVIPIALVAPGSVPTSSPHSVSESLPPASPIRPARAPDLTLNLDHLHVSNESIRAPNPAYAHSQRSGASSLRSYMSGASYASDFLNEAPVIVTQNQGRQVLGVVKAEVIHTSGTSTPTSHLSSSSLTAPSIASRPSIRSPLAATSFGPADVVNETDEDQDVSMRSDPFGDEHSPGGPRASSVPSRPESEFSPDGPTLPWTRKEGSSRPSSISTQSGSIIADIGSATRVNVGLLSAQSAQKSPYRTTMGRLVSPASTNEPTTLEEQQQLALAHAQAQALAQGMDKFKRVSGSSAISATSTKADSILESFHFVPPSPISSRPVRSPPRSPLHQQFTSAAQPSIQAVTETPPSPVEQHGRADEPDSFPPLDPPPSRRTLGLSTGSQLSTASSGLGSFPFQIDSGASDVNSAAPSSFPSRQRASLDTLALMSDLSSYPLSYDRDSGESLPQVPKS
ncbi:hypothetical protein BV22DRAFT_1125750 [Leucogyrophana mollusca]|uniref:Uncharacterized protein n=1 Tax=Leucogyrophana mollusca TaxID=85980 RepID=A0ACB8BVD0_9AGAM|nr:hypothetical protein BV22DRAFT_1125750 [Leucogyrophana mollusca]